MAFCYALIPNNLLSFYLSGFLFPRYLLEVFCLNWFLPVLPNHSCLNAVGNHATRKTHPNGNLQLLAHSAWRFDHPIIPNAAAPYQLLMQYDILPEYV